MGIVLNMGIGYQIKVVSDTIVSSYMLHQMAIQTCNSLAGKVGLTNHLAVMLITLTVTFLLSVACHKWFEKPVANKLNELISNVS